MNRRVMHTCLNPALFQELRKSWPLLIRWQHDGQQVVRRAAFVMRERYDDAFESCEFLGIPIHCLRPSLVVGFELTELHETQRRAHLIDTVIKPGGHDVITKA